MRMKPNRGGFTVFLKFEESSSEQTSNRKQVQRLIHILNSTPRFWSIIKSCKFFFILFLDSPQR